MRWPAYFLAPILAASVFSTANAQGIDCEIGISDPALKDAFCQELSDILLAPFDGGAGTRSDVNDLPADVQAVFEANSEFLEAYRNKPSETLALIRRIQDSGGLQN